MKRILGVAMFTCLVASLSGSPVTIRIAAAANLTGTLNRIAAAFIAVHPEIAADISFGSSGALAAQIRSGAPYDLFLSADTTNPDKLVADGFADPGAGSAAGSSTVYALGVLCVASRLGVDPSGSLDFLRDATYKTIAVATPELAPYGAAAVEAMRNSGVWDAAQTRIVYGTNIAQVGQYVSTGAADAGFINLSAALGDEAFASIPWVRVPRSLYAPIRQGAVVVKGPDADKTAAARVFLAFLLTGPGKTLLEAAGYGTDTGSP